MVEAEVLSREVDRLSVRQGVLEVHRQVHSATMSSAVIEYDESQKRSEAAMSLRPINACLFFRTEQAHGDAPWSLDGSEIGHV